LIKSQTSGHDWPALGFKSAELYRNGEKTWFSRAGSSIT